MMKENLSEELKNGDLLISFLDKAKNIQDINVYKFGSQVVDKEPTPYGDIDLLIIVKDEAQLLYVEDQLVKSFINIVWQNAIILNFERNTYEKYLVTPDGEHVIHLHIFSSKVYTIIRERQHDLLLNTQDKQSSLENTKKYIEHLAIRSYRLLSKIEKGNYQEMIVIFDKLKEELLIPLLSEIYLEKTVTNTKFLDINGLPPHIKYLYIECHPKPTKASCTTAIKSCLGIVKDLVVQGKNKQIVFSEDMVNNLYIKVVSYESNVR